MAKVECWKALCLFFVLCRNVTCYSFMVPQEACFNMLPVHNQTVPQAILPPFKITSEKTFYGPLEEIQINVLSLNNMPFSGFLLQARLKNTNTIVGSWQLNSQMSPFIGVLKCLDKNNSLVHAWPEFSGSMPDGTKSPNYFYNLTALWVAPNATNWDIEFVATIVSKFDTYWTNIKSSPIAPVSRLLRNNSPAPFGQTVSKKICLFTVILYVLTEVYLKHFISI